MTSSSSRSRHMAFTGGYVELPIGKLAVPVPKNEGQPAQRRSCRKEAEEEERRRDELKRREEEAERVHAAHRHCTAPRIPGLYDGCWIEAFHGGWPPEPH